jgi:hypothetical protein
MVNTRGWARCSDHSQYRSLLCPIHHARIGRTWRRQPHRNLGRRQHLRLAISLVRCAGPIVNNVGHPTSSLLDVADGGGADQAPVAQVAGRDAGMVGVRRGGGPGLGRGGTEGQAGHDPIAVAAVQARITNSGCGRRWLWIDLSLSATRTHAGTQPQTLAGLCHYSTSRKRTQTGGSATGTRQCRDSTPYPSPTPKAPLTHSQVVSHVSSPTRGTR